MGALGTDLAIQNGIELRWDAVAGILQVRFTEEMPMATSGDAAWLLEHLERWTRGRSEDFGMLVDCARIENADAGWRTSLANFFSEGSSRRAFAAWYNASGVIQVMVEMFTVATPGLEGSVFTTEAEARAWLHQRGVG